MLSLNKSVFITGGTSGIGAQMAMDYFAKGYRVGVCSRHRSTFDKNISNEKISFYEADVTDKESINTAIADFSKFGLDIIVASAGRGYKNKSAIPNFDDCRDIINLNLIGTINTFEAAIKYFAKEKISGQLVGISSLAAFNGLPGAPAYSASKMGLVQYCESLSLSLASLNISVTCICPGFINTPLVKTNRHPMPFLTEVDVASKKFIDAIEKEKKLFVYPKLFGFITLIIGRLPRFIFRFIIKRSKLNYTKS